MNASDAALLVAALEGHGIRLRVVRGTAIDVQSDDRAVEKEPLELLDELTRRKVEVLAYLHERGACPPPVRVTDTRGSSASIFSSSTPADRDAPTPCRYFPDVHAHDRVGGECLDEHNHQRVMPPGWTRPAHLAHVPLFPAMAMPADYRERQTRAQALLNVDIARLNALAGLGR